MARFVIRKDGRIDDGGISTSSPDELVKVSSSDVVKDYLGNKLIAGANISISVINSGANEDIQISATGGSAPEVTYTPTTASDWTDPDPDDVKEALDQIASRVKYIEMNSGPSPDASAVTYTPGTLSNWNSSADPGDVDNALDQLASRVKYLETNPYNASVIPFTPNVLGDWNSSADPGDVDNALDQLAQRMKDAEDAGASPTVSITATDTTPSYLKSKLVAGTSISLTRNNPGSNETLTVAVSGLDASTVTYAPADAVNHWSGGTDPGNTDDALDQLASRVNFLEDNSGPNPDAANVTFTPLTLTDWTGSSDPGDVDNALDQLAGRTKSLETLQTAGTLPYTPAVASNWSGSTDPGDVDDALDQIASRLKTAESYLPPQANQTGYTPSTLANWSGSADPGDVNDALDQLAYRLKTQENNFTTGASLIVYTPSTLINWNGGFDPGEVDDALNQLASRVKSIETSTFDASNITYTPSDLTKWNSGADPGNSNQAFDQLASRVKTLEGASTAPDAANVTYTPADLTKWNGSADPGDADQAFDQLASRVKSLELGGAGSPDASIVTYTPAVLTDWDAATDPGDTDEALDQLASRIKTLEAAEGGTTSVVGFVSMDSTLNGTYTIPLDYQTLLLDSITVESGSLEVSGQLILIDKNFENNSNYVEYNPTTTTDWNTVPIEASTALDQLADRVNTLEISSGSGITTLYNKWDVFAPPVSTNLKDDEFNNNSFDTLKWTNWDYGANNLSITEDSQGVLISGDGDINEWMGISQPIESGDFTLSTYMMGYSLTENDNFFGLALLESQSSETGKLFFFGWMSTATDFIVGQNYDQYNSSAYDQIAYSAYSGSSVFLRIRRNSTTYYADFSTDGQGWVGNPFGFTLSYVPSHFALVLKRSSATSNYKVRSRFLRYQNSDVGIYAPVSGRTVPVLYIP